MESFKGHNETEKNLAETLLQPEEAAIHAEQRHDQPYDEQSFGNKLWLETKKLWVIVGPSIFSRLALYNMNVVTQAFAGHLGEVELAAISIANTVIVGFNFGLLLGMASALETLCGQAYGAKRYHMLGIYMQRSWIVLFLCCFVLLPFYIFATPLLKFLGQPDEVAEWSGVVAVWLIPLHFSFAFQFPLQRFLQCQLKTAVIAWVSLAGLVVNAVTSWLLVYVWDFGLYGAAISLDISWWVLVFGMYAYTAYGGCPLTWKGFSVEAFSGLWEFLKLSSASGVMLCLENWYYRILVLMTGQLENATIAIDALSICMTINGWEMMIPLAFFAGTGVRVANELGAGNGKGAKFATQVSVTESIVIGVVFCVLIMTFHDYLAYIFTSSSSVLQAVDDMSFLLAITILLNSVQPVLSAYVAYINIGSYYLIGLPLGIIMGWVFKTGVAGIWTGMIFGGTALQTLILIIVTLRCDWEKEAEKARFSVNKSSTSYTIFRVPSSVLAYSFPFLLVTRSSSAPLGRVPVNDTSTINPAGLSRRGWFLHSVYRYCRDLMAMQIFVKTLHRLLVHRPSVLRPPSLRQFYYRRALSWRRKDLPIKQVTIALGCRVPQVLSGLYCSALGGLPLVSGMVNLEEDSDEHAGHSAGWERVPLENAHVPRRGPAQHVPLENAHVPKVRTDVGATEADYTNPSTTRNHPLCPSPPGQVNRMFPFINLDISSCIDLVAGGGRQAMPFTARPSQQDVSVHQLGFRGQVDRISPFIDLAAGGGRQAMPFTARSSRDFSLRIR
ncbi:hypothetical protein V8G54_006071 [Vigna mungo]|uniref:Protein DETOXIFICATION n=1 Tax=Vigna mungo TaxID=3915 RepID=A0AAQ3NZ78_VIGMU